MVLSYTAGRRIQTMTAILKGNSYNSGNLDIKVSKLGWTQNKYIHIFHHMQNNNPEPQMTSRFSSLSLPSCSRAGGGSRQRGPSRLPTSLTWLRSPGILTKVLLLQHQCEQPMCSRNLQVHGGFGLEIGPESSGIQEMVHPENGIAVLLRGLGPPQPGHDQASHTTGTSPCSSSAPGLLSSQRKLDSTHSGQRHFSASLCQGAKEMSLN